MFQTNFEELFQTNFEQFFETDFQDMVILADRAQRASWRWSSACSGAGAHNNCRLSLVVVVVLLSGSMSSWVESEEYLYYYDGVLVSVNLIVS